MQLRRDERRDLALLGPLVQARHPHGSDGAANRGLCGDALVERLGRLGRKHAADAKGDSRDRARGDAERRVRRNVLDDLFGLDGVPSMRGPAAVGPTALC